MKRTNDGRNALGETKHDFALLAEPFEKLALVDPPNRGDFQALESNRGMEGGMVRTVHDGEAAFRDHCFDVERATDYGADDLENVIRHGTA